MPVLTIVEVIHRLTMLHAGIRTGIPPAPTPLPKKPLKTLLSSRALVFERRRPPTLPHCIAVPSAQVGLTSLFGMGRGGTPPQQPPKRGLTYRHKLYAIKKRLDSLLYIDRLRLRKQSPIHLKALPRKKFSGNQQCSALTSPSLHLHPIYVVVCNDPLWSSHLAAGFALRCFQRLTRPDSDTRRCTWRHNR